MFDFIRNIFTFSENNGSTNTNKEQQVDQVLAVGRVNASTILECKVELVNSKDHNDVLPKTILPGDVAVVVGKDANNNPYRPSHSGPDKRKTYFHATSGANFGVEVTLRLVKDDHAVETGPNLNDFNDQHRFLVYLYLDGLDIGSGKRFYCAPSDTHIFEGFFKKLDSQG